MLVVCPFCKKPVVIEISNGLCVCGARYIISPTVSQKEQIIAELTTGSDKCKIIQKYVGNVAFLKISPTSDSEEVRQRTGLEGLTGDEIFKLSYDFCLR
jgi:hypothetical protein